MILLPKGAKIIGQGLTGSEGRICLPTMLQYGTKVVAGVTPGKGGQEVFGVPIFNSVKEAIETVGEVHGSVQFVPPLFVLAATKEAIEAGIKFILIGAEKVPVKDAAQIISLARETETTIVGPSSVGLINPGRSLKIGGIGGSEPERVYAEGEVAVISKSGGMTSEISLHLKNNSLGVSFALGIGGERLVGSDFADWLIALEKDPETRVSVIFGELGGTYEERVAECVKTGKIKKPVIAFIAGEFASILPSGIQFGHAGAIIEAGRGDPKEKRRILKEAGVLVAEKFDDIANLVKKALK
ncbi:MAG: CoA-binding protein [Patescibacteria group bacterium]